jgi:hypothetical protein
MEEKNNEPEEFLETSQKISNAEKKETKRLANVARLLEIGKIVYYEGVIENLISDNYYYINLMNIFQGPKSMNRIEFASKQFNKFVVTKLASTHPQLSTFNIHHRKWQPLGTKCNDHGEIIVTKAKNRVVTDMIGNIRDNKNPHLTITFKGEDNKNIGQSFDDREAARAALLDFVQYPLTHVIGEPILVVPRTTRRMSATEIAAAATVVAMHKITQKRILTIGDVITIKDNMLSIKVNDILLKVEIRCQGIDGGIKTLITSPKHLLNIFEPTKSKNTNKRLVGLNKLIELHEKIFDKIAEEIEKDNSKPDNDRLFNSVVLECPDTECKKTVIVCRDTSRRYNNRGKCPACDKTICLVCKKLTCIDHDDEFDCNMTADEKSEMAVERDAKPCPKCNSKTFKDGGCEHIICKSIINEEGNMCNAHWCWSCNYIEENEIDGIVSWIGCQNRNCLGYDNPGYFDNRPVNNNNLPRDVVAIAVRAMDGVGGRL